MYALSMYLHVQSPLLANDFDHTAIYRLLDAYTNTKGGVFYVGDFNSPRINKRVLIIYVSLAHNNFLPCTMQNGLTQVVDCPTHDPNCIDLVLASNLCLIYDLAVSPALVFIVL